ncbi:MAG: phosphotransferase family protein [Pseudomonadota bacterium]|nr:phosphotransferase family protein [Pseudomonadota bacterium]
MLERRLGEAATEAERDVEAVLRDVEPWADRDIRYRPVLGGISNANWRVHVSGEPESFFVKVPGSGTEMFIDRAAAIQASRKAEALGIGPKIFAYLADRGVEITEFMEGRRSCTNKDFHDPEVRRSAVRAYRTFNDSGPLPLTKTIFDMIEQHFEQVREVGAASPPDFAWLKKQYCLARSALEASGLDLVPCFNDPMPGNFMIDEAKTIMLVDYEFASNNDRCYELAIWCGEMFSTPSVEAEVIEEYFGRHSAQMSARLIVHKALADVKWSTWAMIQNKISKLDFDFFKYGAWKHMRARSVMHDPRWVDYLRAV